jgi:hypothetical protein
MPLCGMPKLVFSLWNVLTNETTAQHMETMALYNIFARAAS